MKSYFSSTFTMFLPILWFRDSHFYEVKPHLAPFLTKMEELISAMLVLNLLHKGTSRCCYVSNKVDST